MRKLIIRHWKRNFIFCNSLFFRDDVTSVNWAGLMTRKSAVMGEETLALIGFLRDDGRRQGAYHLYDYT